VTAHKTYFATCKLINVKLYLSSEFYPYDDLNRSRLWQTHSCYFVWYVLMFPYVLLNPSWKKWTIVPIKPLFERFYSNNFSNWLLATKRVRQEWHRGCMIRIGIGIGECIANTTTYYLIIHDYDRIVQCQMQYARLRKLSSSKNTFSLFLIYEIKSKIFCDQAQSQNVIHHDYTNVCGCAKIYYWKEICHKGSGDVEKRSYCFSLYVYVSHVIEFFDKVRKVLRFLAECLSSWIVMERRNDLVQRNAWLQ